MFAHGDNDVREPVYDLTLPLTASNSAKTGVRLEKIAVENEQSYHIDPSWLGKYCQFVLFTS